MRNALIVIGFALILVPAVTLFTKRFETEMIETGEREELCELIDEITRSGSLDPEDYAGGDGLASEWREW